MKHLLARQSNEMMRGGGRERRTSSRRFHQRPHGLSSMISLSSSESSSSAPRIDGDLDVIELGVTGLARDPVRKDALAQKAAGSPQMGDM
jgi:hypothetical protein